MTHRTHAATLQRRLRNALALCWLALATLTFWYAPKTHAEDIDIYTAAAQSGAQNVLLILDNSANWSASLSVPDCSYADGSGGPKATNPNKEAGTKMAIEKCALYNVLYRLPADDSQPYFNIGVMLFNEGSNNSGYPRSRFLPLTTTNKAALLDLIRNLGINADKTNNASTAETFYEAFQMFMASTVWKGTTGTKYDSGAVESGQYKSVDSSCNNHIIYLANGKPQDSNATALSLLGSVGGDTTAITYPYSYIKKSDQDNWADEWARFLYTRADTSATLDGKQTVRVHAVAVTGASSDGDYPNFIREIARQGGGDYYAASDVDSLTNALLSIFNGMLAINSVFVSAALPISTNAQGTYDNQVFVGLFRPDAKASPRWNGNLKQYQFGYDAASDTLTLVDANGAKATSETTGFLRPEVVSFWTQASTFWTNSPNKADGSTPSASDAPDGAEVERGGAAQSLRTVYATDQSTRPVYTCIGCSHGTALATTASAQFKDSNAAITQAALGAANATERTYLINWARGQDNVPGTDPGAEVPGPGAPVTARASMHGDVLHSRPVVVSYGGSTGNIVFYGSNDGTLRAVYGRADGNGGQELWAFLPEEHFGKLKRLRDNSPEIQLPGSASATAQPRDYLMDGPIGVYHNAISGKVWLFIGMRRGGRFIYALDVSDPLAPKMMWRIRNTDPGFAELGQTWSMPRVALVKSLGVDKPVLIMGGGYDPTEDSLTPSAPTMGHRIYVLDAETGASLRAFTTTRSVPADIALMDADGDGYADRGYIADIGATLYRIDFESSIGAQTPASWSITTLATLGDAANTRKVFFAPDLVATRDFTAVMFGTGDREKPLLTTSDDAFFVVKDTKTTKGAPSGWVPYVQSDLSEQAVCEEQDTQLCDTLKNVYAANDPQGCYLPFVNGERVVNGAATIAGKTYFSTNQPTPAAANTCGGSLGEARTYAFPLFCEPAQYNTVTGGGLPPTAVTGYVNIDGRRIPFVLGAVRNRLDPEPPQLSVPQIKQRTYWFLENQGR